MPSGFSSTSNYVRNQKSSFRLLNLNVDFYEFVISCLFVESGEAETNIRKKRVEI
jgi:hypothetical protein